MNFSTASTSVANSVEAPLPGQHVKILAAERLEVFDSDYESLHLGETSTDTHLRALLEPGSLKAEDNQAQNLKRRRVNNARESPHSRYGPEVDVAHFIKREWTHLKRHTDNQTEKFWSFYRLEVAEIRRMTLVMINSFCFTMTALDYDIDDTALREILLGPWLDHDKRMLDFTENSPGTQSASLIDTFFHHDVLLTWKMVNHLIWAKSRSFETEKTSWEMESAVVDWLQEASKAHFLRVQEVAQWFEINLAAE